MTRYYPTVSDRIFQALCENPYGLTCDELIEYVYPDPDHEPDMAADNIRVHISMMNTRWKKRNAGFRVKPAGMKRYRIFVRRVRK